MIEIKEETNEMSKISNDEKGGDQNVFSQDIDK